MECPKCHNEVGEHDKICPYCKKVLLLECPICHKFNRTALCSECGYVILSKCHNCGQLNPTIKGKCKKCGFDTSKSISMNEAETDEFACLAITFPNLEDLRPALKNKQIFNKFYKQLKSFIFNYGQSQDNRVRLIDNAFIIKYYKEFSMTSSVNKAVKSAIELMNKIAEISYKLKKQKNVKMACKMAILKRTLENDNRPFNTGLNIKLIDNEIKKDNYANGLQIITDQHINNIISRQYKLEMIYSSQVDDELLEFYEFPIAGQLTPIIEDDTEKKQGLLNKPKELPKISELEEEELVVDLYTNKIIDIHTKCEFLSLPAANIPNKLKEFLKKKTFITLKSTDKLSIYSKDIRDAILSTTNNLMHVVCTGGFVYEPFACFKELVADYLGYDSKMAKLDPVASAKLKQIDQEGYIYKLLIHKEQEEVKPEEALQKYMEIFYGFFSAQKGATILIENFDLIDETSLEIIIGMASSFEEMGISFVVTVPENYLVHKEINELLYLDSYKEITVVKSQYEYLVSQIEDDITEIQDSFYIRKIQDQFLGSSLYFKHAMNYLKDAHVVVSIEGKLKISSEKSLIFPAALEALITKRFELLPENEGLILAYSSILGDKIHTDILKELEIEEINSAVESLQTKGLIDFRNSMIIVQNYKIVKNCIKEALTDEVKSILTKNILEKLHARNLEILKSLGLVTKSQLIIYELSLYAINHGDFNAYLRNCKRFLSLVDPIPRRNLLPELIEAKNTIYSTISNYINKYPSHKIYAIARIIFDDAVRKKDDLRIMNLSSLMLDSALMGENYILAQQSLQQVLVRMLNPKLTEGNGNIQSKYFFYSCINAKILFHAGKFKQCIEILDKTIDSITEDLLEQLQRSNVSKDAFVSYFMSILIYGALSRVIICDPNLDSFFEKINYMFNSDIASKGYIMLFNKLIHKEEFEFTYEEEFESMSKILSALINAFKTFDGDYNLFAQNIYQTKLASREGKESFFSLISDLIIGYSYQKLGSATKASVIFKDVANTAQKSGMEFISVLANWFIANLKYSVKDFDSAYKIISDNIFTIKKIGINDKLVYILSEILLVNTVVSQHNIDVDIQPLLYKINYTCEKFNFEYLKEQLIDYTQFVEDYNAKHPKKKKEAEIADTEQQEIPEENQETPNSLDAPNEPTEPEPVSNQGE